MTSQQRDFLLADTKEAVDKGANWFYWIVGLSLVNVVLALAEANRHFLIGMAMTEIGAAFITDPDGGTVFKVIGGGLIVVILVGFLLLGRRAHKPSKAAFIVGIVLYALDGIIYLIDGDYLSVAFHGYVIFHFYMGYKAVGEYLEAYHAEVTENEPQVEEAPKFEAVVEETPEASVTSSDMA
ncbi:MAG: hypothetical protein U0T73_05865 [Chitinophagales bacterium]